MDDRIQTIARIMIHDRLISCACSLRVEGEENSQLWLHFLSQPDVVFFEHDRVELSDIHNDRGEWWCVVHPRFFIAGQQTQLVMTGSDSIRLQDYLNTGLWRPSDGPNPDWEYGTIYCVRAQEIMRLQQARKELMTEIRTLYKDYPKPPSQPRPRRGWFRWLW